MFYLIKFEKKDTKSKYGSARNTRSIGYSSKKKMCFGHARL